MSLTEMKESAKQLTPIELEELALHVEFLRHTADPAWREEIRRRAEVTEGWSSEEQVKALHERRNIEGL
ncbi:MAG: hypothetical protein ABJF10_08625 [Chthoniobacter sp.]|uniref:hypothetical protein n=1 Tax=Chthoniobacter sp. TaxID=2510640 RepID=UPI0032A20ADC